MDSLDIYQSNEPTLDFTITDDDDLAIILTDSQVKFLVKKTPSSTTYIIDKQCDITDADNGLARVTLSESETSTAGTFYAELMYIKDDKNLTLAQWIFNIKESLI